MKKCFILAVMLATFLACNNNSNDTQRDMDRTNDSLEVQPPDSTMSYPADSNRADPSFPR